MYYEQPGNKARVSIQDVHKPVVNLIVHVINLRVFMFTRFVCVFMFTCLCVYVYMFLFVFAEEGSRRDQRTHHVIAFVLVCV